MRAEIIDHMLPAHPPPRNQSDCGAIWQSRDGVDSKNSLGRFMNPWEIPAEAVTYSRAKESMRSGSGPRLSLDIGIRAKHDHQVYKSLKGRGPIGWII